MRDFANEFVTFANTSDRLTLGNFGSISYKYGVERGRKFSKITQVMVSSNTNHNRSVHCFIDNATGDIYKPASWKAPAKHVRYNWDKDRDTLEKTADPYGRYLYLNR